MVGLLVGATHLLAQNTPEQFSADLKALASWTSRTIGSEGYEKASQYIRDEIARLVQRHGATIDVREHTFDVLMPVTTRADLTLPSMGAGQPGPTVKVYPFWPAAVRVNSTPPQGIEGELVYCGKGSFADIKPGLVRGNIAVVESTAGGAWTQAAYFGAKAILVLENRDKPDGGPTQSVFQTNNIDLRSHELLIPVHLPRYYIPDDDAHHELVEALRQGKLPGKARLVANISFQERRARNFYVLVRSPALAAAARMPMPAQWLLGRTMNYGPKDWPQAANPAALVIQAMYDAGSLVPDLAPGASQAVQAASALAMLRDLAANPLAKPVVVAFVGADSQHLRGTREMLMAFADPPSFDRGWKEQLKELSAKEEALAVDLRRALAIAGDPGKLRINEDRGLIDRLVKLVETDIFAGQDDLFRLRRLPSAELTPADERRIEELEDSMTDLAALRHTLQQRPTTLAQTLRPSRDPNRLVLGEKRRSASRPAVSGSRTGPADMLLPPARQYLQRAVDRMKRLERDQTRRRAILEERIALFRWLAVGIQRDPDPDPRGTNTRLIDTLVSLDLSDGGRRVGPMTWGHHLRADAVKEFTLWREWYNSQEKNKARWLDDVRGVLDMEPVSGTLAKQSYLCASMPIQTEPALAWGVPGFALITLEDMRLRRDTPMDLLVERDGRIVTPNVGAILPQLAAVKAMLTAAGGDPDLKCGTDTKWARNILVEGQVVSPAVGRPVPDLPRDGFIATFYYAAAKKAPQLQNLPYTIGMRKFDVVPTDAEGNYRFEGLSTLQTSNESKLMTPLAIEVYKLAPDGSIVACSDLGKQSGDVKVFADVKNTLDPVRSLAFNCEEFTVVGLYDPRFLQDLNELTILDQRRNADPQRFSYIIHRQMMAGFVEPGQYSYLLFRYGRVGNRLALLNNAEIHRGRPRGFNVGQLDDLRAPALQTTWDFWRLDAQRLADYRQAGVVSKEIDAQHAESKQLLDAAEQAMKEGANAQEVMRPATGAWALVARSYSAIKEMANDVIRGAIFLLLLCIPFAFCIERLLIGTPNIYKQIAGVFVIFTIMALVLSQFHPAFRISSSPLIIILSFAIIFMSIVVISVVYGKFDTELKRLRSGRGTAMATSFARASVLMSAVLLGIANMRKRKFRTALTCVTVVLITFAVLCFTSSSRYLDTTSLPTGEPRRYYGLMMRQRGFRPMPGIFLDNLRAALAEKDLIKTTDMGEGVVVERWWNVSSDYKDNLNVSVVEPARPRTTRPATARADTGTAPASTAAARPARSEGKPPAPKKPLAMKALVGLSPGESKIQPALAEVVANFGRLEAGDPKDQNIIYTAETTAAEMGIKVGDRVRIGGIELELAGTFDAAQFDARVFTLSGDAITPLNYQIATLDAGGQRLNETKLETLSLDQDDTAAELATTYEHLYSSQVAIVPAAISRMLPHASLRSVAIKCADNDETNKVARRVATNYALAIYVGDESGVRMVAAGQPWKVSGAGQVAIPIAIAGLIIFNTMMGSIAERRREIHVYTSLGLAPLHVGALFVAEAMTYGLIGTVFGYIIGQGVGTVLTKLDWLGGVTLNYSGTSAIMTMGLILVIVLLSALVPARLASKIAAPSIERTWRVPLPKGDEIVANLPFTINKTAADGVLAYLAEYLDAHQEGSIGKFSAGKVDVFHGQQNGGAAVRGLKTIIWLTPFDLGVRQHLMLLVHPGQYEDIYEVQLVLQRMSGDDGSWYRMNRTFLTEIRKQFLQWRSLTPQRMLQYVQESKQLLASGHLDPASHVVPTEVAQLT